jgi:hypothetical protein
MGREFTMAIGMSGHGVSPADVFTFFLSRCFQTDLEKFGATVAANPSFLGRWMGSSERQILRLDDWIQTSKIRTVYRSIDYGLLGMLYKNRLGKTEVFHVMIC